MSVDHLHDGLKLWMVGTIEKHSDVLGRNAIWNKTVRIAKLPQYLCIQFMRFFWKATPENADRAGTKCKILRTVSFTEVCTSVSHFSYRDHVYILCLILKYRYRYIFRIWVLLLIDHRCFRVLQ